MDVQNEKELIKQLEATGQYKILKRIPKREQISANPDQNTLYRAMILDLETMGLNSKMDKIIELGLISFTFKSDGTIVEVVDSLNQLQDPDEPIPEQITQITGITDAEVKGQEINWHHISHLLEETHLCIAHNAKFDRSFLEGPHVPDTVSEQIRNMAFGCSQRDIDWRKRGYESTKLEYLNFKSGYFYGNHRALNDCEATLNIIIENNGSFDELLNNVRKNSYLIIAQNAPYEKKDELKTRSYKWSDGNQDLPKGWWTIVAEDNVEEESAWLNDEIFDKTNHADSLPRKKINARNRYSPRAEIFDHY